MTQVLELEQVLDVKAAASLQASLVGARGGLVRLDGSGVQRLGGLCLQVLLAADRAWADDGQVLEIAPRSAALAEALSLFGADGILGGQRAAGGRTEDVGEEVG